MFFFLAPGLVQNLIVYRPQHSNNYTQMDVKWNIPQLRDRNSEIKEYILKHNISGVISDFDIPKKFCL